MPRHGYSDEDLALLTDEELAGLEDDSIVDEGATDDDDHAGDPAPSADQPEKPASEATDEPAKEPAAAEAPVQPAAAADDPATPTEPVASEQPDAPSQAAPRLLPQYDVPANATEQIAQFDTQIDELARKFDEGELTAQEHRAALKPIEAQKQALHDQILKHQLSLDAQVSQWAGVTVPAFLAQHPEYEPGSVLFNTLNEEVKKLQRENNNPFDAGYLETAHQTIQASIRKSYGLPENPTAPANPTAKPRREIPPTLGGLPSSDITDTADGGEFAYLDRLADKDPIAFEEAIAKLTPEKLEAYLAV